MTKSILLAAGALFIGSAAQAQYYPPQPGPYLAYGEVPRDERVFTGVRAEIRLSYDRLKVDMDDDEVFAPNRRDGLGYGGEVGFDLPLGPVTLGGYAGIDGSTIRECQEPAADILGGTTICVRPGRSITAGGRIGVPVGSSLLLFAKGGYTNGFIRVDATRAVLDGNVVLRQNLNGYHLGGGVEAALSPRTYGKLEYVYTKLRHFHAATGDPADDTDFDRQQVQAALGVRF